MKKILLPVLLFIMFMPFMVNAYESCTVVSGNGKDIGSEIACGTEHFYVVDNKDGNIKMLAKYNLYVGANFNKIVLDVNSIYYKNCRSDYNSSEIYYFEGEEFAYFDEWTAKIAEKYNLDFIGSLMWNDENGNNRATHTWVEGEEYTDDDKICTNSTLKLYPYTVVENNLEGYALQNSKALGVTGEKGNANYPIYATTNLFDVGYLGDDMWNSRVENHITNIDMFEEGYINFDFIADTRIMHYLYDYYNNLTDMGFNILDVDMLNMKDIYDLVYSISNKELPLTDWYDDLYNNQLEVDDDNKFYYGLGDLKEYVSNDYTWIWNTTYWTKTLSDVDMSEYYISYYDVYFVTSKGEICATGSDECVGIPRAGIRPVVTIPSDNLKYSIKTKTDGNGTIETIESASGGENIQFKVSAKKGLKLSRISITTDSGENIEFTEEDITIDETGVYSISKNKFTMPYENVTIEAIWESTIKNPNTGVTNYELILYFVMLICTGLYIFFKIKKSHI